MTKLMKLVLPETESAIDVIVPAANIYPEMVVTVINGVDKLRILVNGVEVHGVEWDSLVPKKVKPVRRKATQAVTTKAKPAANPKVAKTVVLTSDAPAKAKPVAKAKAIKPKVDERTALVVAAAKLGIKVHHRQKADTIRKLLSDEEARIAKASKKRLPAKGVEEIATGKPVRRQGVKLAAKAK